MNNGSRLKISFVIAATIHGTIPIREYIETENWIKQSYSRFPLLRELKYIRIRSVATL